MTQYDNLTNYGWGVIVYVIISCFSPHYRTMHYSAKHGIENAYMSSVRPTVCPSVCDVGIDIWNTWVGNLGNYLRGQLAQHLRPLWEKVACWSTKAAISLKRVKIEETFLWMAYRNLPTLCRTVPPPTPYGLPFSKIGGLQPPPKTPIVIISGTGTV